MASGIVVIGHWPVLRAQALSFDDNEFLTYNRLVQNPGWDSVRTFFGEILEPSTVSGYYTPLTMTSLMLDYAMGGRPDNLRPFHVTNLSLHVLCTVLVVLFLYQLFGQVVPAALVGLLFGLHPLTVEPVVWIAERKTLLAGLFTLACLVSYLRYVRRGSRVALGTSVAMYALAALSKPTALPLPVLLVLLDWWPLARLRWLSLVEKIPYMLIGGLFVTVTVISHARSASIVPLSEAHAGHIVVQMCYLITFYLQKMVWPCDLSSVYMLPEPMSLASATVLVHVMVTCGLGLLLLVSIRRTRGLLCGSLFFFVAIFPTLGAIQFSWVVASDKYVYIPSLGLWMILAAALSWAWQRRWRHGRALKTGLVALVLLLAVGESVGTRRYLVHWRDSVTLMTYMVRLAPNSAAAHNNLGFALESADDLHQAVFHYREAARLHPGEVFTECNLGRTLVAIGRRDEAIVHFSAAVQAEPSFVEAYVRRGAALLEAGRARDAADDFAKVLNLAPNSPSAFGVHLQLADALVLQGELDRSIQHYAEAIRLQPSLAVAHNKLGVVLERMGRRDEAIAHFLAAVRIRPNYTEARDNLRRARAAQDERKPSSG